MKGRFGINEIITSKELAEMLARAEEIAGGRIILPEHGRLTRGQAVDMVIKAMCDSSFAHTEAAED